MSRLIRWTSTVLAVIALALAVSDTRGGTVQGVAVRLDGQPNPGVSVSTGVDTQLSGANGAFTVTTPNIRPFTLTLEKADLTVLVNNLDGFAPHNVTVVVPDSDEMATPYPSVDAKPHRWFFHRR